MTTAKPKKRHSSDHAWRAHEDDRTTKKLRRKFRGSHRGAEKREQPSGEKRVEHLRDSKGRPVAVERYGQPPQRAPREERKDKSPHSRRTSDRAPGRYRASDRASGPRPRQPRGRR